MSRYVDKLAMWLVNNHSLSDLTEMENGPVDVATADLYHLNDFGYRAAVAQAKMLASIRHGVQSASKCVDALDIMNGSEGDVSRRAIFLQIIDFNTKSVSFQKLSERAITILTEGGFL